jgi:hypothetical protein
LQYDSQGGTVAGALQQLQKSRPSANSFGGWLMSAFSWRGTFCDLQVIISKCLATKKLPAKALGGEVSLAGNFSSAARD